MELKELIDQWHAANPDQIYPWYVRLSDFSGQRAARLAAVQQSGGLLSEAARARETAEEIQAFAERVLFYLQRVPTITSHEFESSVSDILQHPEIVAMVSNTDRFVTAVELNLLLDTLREVASDEQGLTALIDEIVAAEDIIARQAFWYTLTLIAAFFVMLHVYRLVATRLIRNQDSLGHSKFAAGSCILLGHIYKRIVIYLYESSDGTFTQAVQRLG